MPAIRRALLSVSDKRGLVQLARALRDLGVELISTGGTAKTLSDSGIAVTMVSDHTGAPEILDGRVKTLHPKIHGGLLGRSIPSHERQMREQGIEPIDLVVVNLYPFEETVASEDVTLEDAIEQIDIGGPSILRSAAKNYERVSVLADPGDYDKFVDEMRAGDGGVSAATRASLARKVFVLTAAYDAAIAKYLNSVSQGSKSENTFPDDLTMQYERVLELRYGENPHQSAAFYRNVFSPMHGRSYRPSIADARILQGKPLSYNNILDLDAALACCVEHEVATAVIVKHTNPCGVASNEGSIADAYLEARACDPMSAFGGIVAVNRPLDEALARLLAETFLECVVAPSYSDGALALLGRKKNVRLAEIGRISRDPGDMSWSSRSVLGGLLVQESDFSDLGIGEAKVVSKRQPSAGELASLVFAWRVVKHVKSNAIIFCRDLQTVAIGAGQMSRVDAAQIAVTKAQVPLQGTVVASDAFFPFRDGLEALAAAGAVAVIQPGGSKRDAEVIAAADEYGMTMIFTGVRHFRH